MFEKKYTVGNMIVNEGLEQGGQRTRACLFISG